jgi:hypothetical protein
MATKKERIYISGKMSGLPREEVKYRFALCELWLRHGGAKEVVNPTKVWAWRWPWLYSMIEMVVGAQAAYELVLLYDLWKLSHCTRIHMIGTDWSTSRGAKTEMGYAQAKNMDVTIDIDVKKKK